MANKPILSIDIDDKQFKAFLELYAQFEEKVGALPDEWKRANAEIQRTSREMRNLSGSATGAFDSSAKGARDMTSEIRKASEAQRQFQSFAGTSSQTLGKMAKDAKALGGEVFGIGKNLMHFGVLGGGAAFGGAIALARAIDGSVNKLAGQNLQARSLGLKIGETQAFDSNFEKFGLSHSDLSNVADAQSDVTRWKPLLMAKLSPQQIKNDSSEQLLYEFDKAASAQYRQWQKEGKPAGTMAQAYGFTDILSPSALRTGASYSDSDFDASQRKYLSDAKRNAIDQGVADSATDVKSHLRSDWDAVANQFNEQLAKAGPELEKLGDAASAASIAFLKIAGPQVKELAAALAGPPIPRPAPGQDYPPGLAGGLAVLGYQIRDLSAHPIGSVGKASWNDRQPDAVDQARARMFKANADHVRFEAEQKYHLPRGLLRDQQMAESHLDPFATGPMTKYGKARGIAQFIESTGKQYGVTNPNDPYQETDAQARYDADLAKKYHGDFKKVLAGYNWGPGNLDRELDVANSNHREASIPSQSLEYQRKILAALAKQKAAPVVRIENQTSARVSVSTNAAAQ